METEAPKETTPPIRITERRRRFIDLYLTTAKGVASRAAREAGFGSPETMGPRLARQLKEAIEVRRVQLKAEAQIGSVEVQERLAQLARDPTHKDHFRALELMSKIHGLLSDKLDITISRKQLQDDVSQAMGALSALSARQPRAALPEKVNADA